MPCPSPSPSLSPWERAHTDNLLNCESIKLLCLSSCSLLGAHDSFVAANSGFTTNERCAKSAVGFQYCGKSALWISTASRAFTVAARRVIIYNRALECCTVLEELIQCHQTALVSFGHAYILSARKFASPHRVIAYMPAIMELGHWMATFDHVHADKRL